MTTVLTVEGMSCAHCEAAVKKALESINGVTEVKIDLTAKSVTIIHSPDVTADELRNMIEEQGYDVV